jgi:hypothetical protein
VFDIYNMSFEIKYHNNLVICEIQNECVLILILMTLFVITWNDGWMVYAFPFHYEGEGFNSLLWHLVHALRLQVTYMPKFNPKNYNFVFIYC